MSPKSSKNAALKRRAAATKTIPKPSKKRAKRTRAKIRINFIKLFIATSLIAFVSLAVGWIGFVYFMLQDNPSLNTNKVQNSQNKIIKHDVNKTADINVALKESKRASSVLERQNTIRDVRLDKALQNLPKIAEQNISQIKQNISNNASQTTKIAKEEQTKNISKNASKQNEKNIFELIGSKDNKKETKQNTKEQKAKSSKKDGILIENYAQDTYKYASAKKKSKGAKLVIIMDDISLRSQVNKIKALKMNITPAIFPPLKWNPQSNLLADDFSVYLVHLPLAAYNYKDATNQIPTSASNKQIKERIKAIKRDFKGVKYINNHTGSAFTANYTATKKLLDELKAQNISFIDSVTTSNSAVPQASKELGLRYVYRDVFLDNVQSESSILAQLQIAVNIAKRDGHAIAICHPHAATFAALKRAKNSILNGVDVVYLDEIYGLYN